MKRIVLLIGCLITGVWLLLPAPSTAQAPETPMPRRKVSAEANVLFPFIAKQLNPSSPPGGMTQPQVDLLQVSGPNLVQEWQPVISPSGLATVYEVWKNNSPTPAGATLMGTTANTRWSTPLSLGVGSQILAVNRDFESGDLTGYSTVEFTGLAPNSLVWAITSAVKHGGAYAMKFDTTLVGIQGETKATMSYPIVAGQSYTLSAWINVVHADANHLLNLVYWFEDPNYAPHSVTGYISQETAATAGWVQRSVTITAPANTYTAKIEISYNGLSGTYAALAYVDDLSILGPPPPNAATELWSIRAMDPATRQYSPYSTWRTPYLVDAVTATATQSPSRGLIATATADQVPTKVFAGDGTLVTLPTASSGPGDGSDGALSTSGNVTLTKEMNYTDLTINAGHTLFTKGFKIFVSGTLSINATGIIDCSGGVGGVGGLAAGHAGGAGGVPAYTTLFSDIGTPGTGGAGAATAGSPGGSNGFGGFSTSVYGASPLVPLQVCAGCGGGGGASHDAVGNNGSNGIGATFGDGAHFVGGTGGNASGATTAYVYGAGGGGGGGVIRIYCKTINNAGTIRANGGVGGAGYAGSGYASGNGAGGGGGVVLVFYRATAGSGVGTLQVNGGAAGSGGNGGAAGSTGVAASFQV